MESPGSIVRPLMGCLLVMETTERTRRSRTWYERVRGEEVEEVEGDERRGFERRGFEWGCRRVGVVGQH